MVVPLILQLQGAVLAVRAQSGAATSGPAESVRELGFLRGRQGRMNEALALLRSWVLVHPEDLSARLAAVQAAVELARVDDAEALLAGVAVDSAAVRVSRAQVARLRGEPRAVLDSLEPLLAKVPAGLERMVDGLFADALVNLGRGREAADRLRRWVATDANLALLFAQASYQSGDVAEALEALDPWARRALSLDLGTAEPPDATAAALLLESGRMLQATERSADAIRLLEVGVRWNPRSAQGWLNLGQALATLGRRAEAQQALARFSELANQPASPSPAAQAPTSDPSPPG